MKILSTILAIYPLLLTVFCRDDIVSTFVGSSQGFRDGFRTNSMLDSPNGVAIDLNGDMIVADKYNHRIRRITPNGNVSTIAGNSNYGFKDDFGTNAMFIYPNDVAVDSNGNIIVCDSGNHRIRRITPNRNVSTIAGSTGGTKDGLGTNAMFYDPSSVAVDKNGNIYVSQTTTYRIRKITPNGNVTTFAGNSNYGYKDDFGTNAMFLGPYGVAVDLAGNILVADGYRIRCITPNGNVSTFAGSTQGFRDDTGTRARFYVLLYITVDLNGTIYVADSHIFRIRRVTPNGVVSTFAGASRGFKDDFGTNAMFDFPVGLAADFDGNIIVADSGNHKIRKIGNKTSTRSVPVFVCPSNAACHSGASTFSCLPGFTFNATLNGCSLCPLGQFKSTVGNANCTFCPVGQESIRNRTFCISCQSETYRSSTDSSNCLACPVNSECTSSLFTCNSGYISNNQSTGCIQCPIGTESNSNRTICISCSNGSYRSSTEHSECMKCPDNAQCTSIGFNCNQGYRTNSTNNGCSQCSIGTESNSNRTECVTCRSRFYRPTLTFPNCTTCPDNSKCNSTFFTCLPGFQLNSDLNDCVACSDGFVKPLEGNANCTICDIGQEPNTNKTVCVECSEGYIKPTKEYLVCAECPVGARCTARNLTCLSGYTPHQNKFFSCLNCQDGYFKSQEGNFGCDKCTAGFYSSDDFTTCFNCPSGYFMNSTGSCNRCGIGRQPVFNRTFCIDCPSNTYKPNDDIYNLCLKCPNGATCTTSSFTCKAGYEVSPSQTGCSVCMPGYYKLNSGNNNPCLACPVGYQSSADRTNCQPCVNSYRPSLNFGFCQPCPLYTECSLDKFTCIPGFGLKNGECVRLNENIEAHINHGTRVKSAEKIRITSMSDTWINSANSILTWHNFYMKELFYAYAIPIVLIILLASFLGYRTQRQFRQTEMKKFGDLTKKGVTVVGPGITSSMMAITSTDFDQVSEEI